MNKTPKNSSPFNSIEREILKGMSTKVATKRACSKEYVNKIIGGKRPLSTPKARTVYADLLQILDALTIKIA